MLKLKHGIIELYRKVATSLPPDVEEALKTARDSETEGSEARKALDKIIQDISTSRKGVRPVCMETGLPVFFVSVPQGLGHEQIRQTIIDATREATAKVPLSSSAINVLTSCNTGDNVGEGFPVIHLKQSSSDSLMVDLMLRCSDCEISGYTYTLPDESIGAQRDLDGVIRCAVDAVKRASGRGCPPYVVGVGVGASRDQVTAQSRKQLLRKLNDRAEDAQIAELEDSALQSINDLGIGPMGYGGKNTALAVKVGMSHRLTGSFIVDVSLNCWAMRRGRLIW